MVVSATQSFGSALVIALSLESVSFYGVFGQGPLHLIDDAQMVTVHCQWRITTEPTVAQGPPRPSRV